MPYRAVLEQLVRSVRGVRAALMFDSEGEVVLEAGERSDRHRLIGAYQGLALAAARRTFETYAAGRVRYMVYRYDGGRVILRPLLDGYYLVLSLAADGDLPHGVYLSEEAQARMNAAL
jgi:predicted regulator of Ras-like GTPase activity (Roadblock/LC7/MglB family)